MTFKKALATTLLTAALSLPITFIDTQPAFAASSDTKSSEARPKAKPAKAASPEALKEKPRKAAKTAKERTEPLNFRVTAEFRRAFKRAAAAQDCKKVELLERVFAEWQARNPA